MSFNTLRSWVHKNCSLVVSIICRLATEVARMPRKLFFSEMSYSAIAENFSSMAYGRHRTTNDGHWHTYTGKKIDFLHK